MVNLSNFVGEYSDQPSNMDTNSSSGGGGINEIGKDGNDGNQSKKYTMPAVLHFLQHEWSRFEMERAQWEMERAELQARISFLQGERKGQENLKMDLVRRIKMLELSLRQERLKHFRELHPGEEMVGGNVDPSDDTELDQSVPMEADAVVTQSNANWRQGRNLLRQYLAEIGYSDTILDVRSFRVRNLLGLNHGGGQRPGAAVSDSGDSMAAVAPVGGRIPADVAEPILHDAKEAVDRVTYEFLRNVNAKDDGAQDDSDSDNDDVVNTTVLTKHKTGGMSADEEAVLDDQFAFLSGDKHASGGKLSSSGKRQSTGEDPEWGMNEQAWQRMNQYKQEAKRAKEKRASQDSVDLAGAPAAAGSIPGYLADASGGMPVDIDAALGLSGTVNEQVDIREEFAEEDEAVPRKWNLRYSLRNHLDAVRAMQFHPVEPLLCTAGEDGTMKLWNLSRAQPDDAKSTISDLDPVYTFRAHRSAVLALVLSPTGDMAYTAGADGTVRCWMLPSPNNDQYDKYDPRTLVETLSGHRDAVWSVALHASDNRLVSASADGFIKLWEPGNAQPMLKTYGPPRTDAVPIGVDYVSTEPQQLLTAYYPGTAGILDLETGKTVLSFDCSDDAGRQSRLTAICPHPTMAVSVTAGEDKRIRYFDNNSGQLIHNTVAHVDGISCLALDPNGLYLLSGAHDGSLRLWNMEKRVCLQEIAAHRKKFDESVLAVAFHPSRPLIGSAGADALAKVYA